MSKAEGVQNLCLPMIFKMKIQKEDNKNGWGLGHLLRKFRNEAANSSSAEDMFGDARILDYKIVALTTEHSATMKVPFNV